MSYFQWITIPFAMTNSHTAKIVDTSETWIGTYDTQYTGEWIDFAMLLVGQFINHSI